MGHAESLSVHVITSITSIARARSVKRAMALVLCPFMTRQGTLARLGIDKWVGVKRNSGAHVRDGDLSFTQGMG